MGESLIVMEDINKSFPGVRALANARFELQKGELHALVGENGAGKSTLMKILAGVYSLDSGTITYKGKHVEIPNPRSAQNLGISMIHQELNLMSHLTVAENVFIGREPLSAMRFVLNDRKINQDTQRLLDMLHLDIKPTAKISGLAIAKQQMIEITKALSFNSEVLIMDEPTATLTDSEIQELFAIIDKLRAQGVGIVYISHRLEELKMISDRITVMRDGHYIDTVPTPDITIDEIISMMVGRTIYASGPVIPQTNHSDIALKVSNLNRGKILKDINFEVKRGEILGFAGLVGAGRTEVARAIVAADRVDSIETWVGGKQVHIHTPADAVEHGIGYLSEDRKHFGIVTAMDIETNIAMASFKKFLRFSSVVDTKKTAKTAEELVKKLSIKTPSIKQLVKNLSGGNQQKVVIAKWLAADSDVFIFDEPTRGIDVGAKSEIYDLLNELAQQGKAIIMISSELPEILRMSHRIIVMCNGRITGELKAEEATQEKIMTYATQLQDPK